MKPIVLLIFFLVSISAVGQKPLDKSQYYHNESITSYTQSKHLVKQPTNKLIDLAKQQNGSIIITENDTIICTSTWKIVRSSNIYPTNKNNILNDNYNKFMMKAKVDSIKK